MAFSRVLSLLSLSSLELLFTSFYKCVVFVSNSMKFGSNSASLVSLYQFQKNVEISTVGLEANFRDTKMETDVVDFEKASVLLGIPGPESLHV